MLITGTTLEDNYLAWIAFDTNATVPSFEFTTLHFRVAGGVAKILCDEGLYKNANIKTILCPYQSMIAVSFSCRILMVHTSLITGSYYKQYLLVPTPTFQKNF